LAGERQLTQALAGRGEDRVAQRRRGCGGSGLAQRLLDLAKFVAEKL
jgi:hypothetical protein